MKKFILISLLTMLLFSLVFSVSVYADGKKGEVIDNTGMVSDETVAAANGFIDKAFEKYGYSVVVVFDKYLEEESRDDVAKEYYNNNGYSKKGGIILYVGVNSRIYSINRMVFDKTSLIDNDEYDMIDDQVYNYLHNNRFEDAIEVFAEQALYSMDNGTAMTYVIGEKTIDQVISVIVISMLVGLGVSLIIMFAIKSSMKNIRPQNNAAVYAVTSSFKLNTERDRFLYSRITKMAKPQNNQSGGGGRSSGGGSRGGRF